MARLFSGLWKHPDFMKLWIGQTISEFGSRITREGLPLAAVLVLNATPAQLGVLRAVSSLPVLLLGLLAGVWVDRARRRPIMIFCDVARLVLLMSIPLVAVTGYLSIELIMIVSALTAVFGLFFDIAYRSLLPSLVSREHLVDANTKLATTDSLAEIGGPAIAGVLIQIMTAPLAIFFDAVSFLFSAVSFWLIRTPEPVPPRLVTESASAVQATLRDLAEGIKTLWRDPVLRTLAITMAMRSFFGSFIGVLYEVYAIRELGLSPALVGLTIAFGGVGALIGSLLAGWLPKRASLGRVLVGALLASGLVNLLIPLAGGEPMMAAAVLIMAQIIGDAAMMIYFINEMSLRQMRVPDHLLGRVNGSIGFLAEGVSPFGALIAGGLAALINVRLTLVIAVVGILAAAGLVWLSPVRQLMNMSEKITA